MARLTMEATAPATSTVAFTVAFRQCLLVDANTAERKCMAGAGNIELDGACLDATNTNVPDGPDRSNLRARVPWALALTLIHMPCCLDA